MAEQNGQYYVLSLGHKAVWRQWTRKTRGARTARFKELQVTERQAVTWKIKTHESRSSSSHNVEKQGETILQCSGMQCREDERTRLC